MSVRRILFADNDIEFLSARAEILERAGYKVTTARSLAQAETFLHERWFHLAVVDVRLEDDYDERDLSGIRLAKQETHGCIPKIILTKFPEYIQEMLDGLSPILNFIAKGDELHILLDAMDRVFTQRLHINWGLVIQHNFQGTNSFLQLASHLQHNLVSEIVLDRAGEMEDLFRRIFYDCKKIYIDRLIWHRDGRVAVTVIALREEVKSESFVVVCGLKDLIQTDLQRYKVYSPKAYSGNGTVLVNSYETLHYAASTFALAGSDLENIQTLDEFYRTKSEKQLQVAFTDLYQNTLPAWNEGKSLPGGGRSLAEIYQERLKLPGETFTESYFDERLRYIEQEVKLDGFRFKREGGKVSMRYGEKAIMIPTHFDQLPMLMAAEDVDRLIHVSGSLADKTVLVDESGHSWLTDFSEAGLAPMYWNYISLEAAIRYDWVESKRMYPRYQLENCLIRSEFERLVMDDLELPVRKPVHAIQMIRKLAARAVGKETTYYNFGILFEALRRSADFDIHSPMKENEKLRLAHIHISILLLLSLFGAEKRAPGAQHTEKYPELQLEPTTYTVVLGEQRYRLDPRPFKLLHYLYEHAEKICTKEELQQKVIGENYNPTYIHTLIGRIRDVIEIDPGHPVYLITEHNIGYKLIVRP